MHLQWNRNQAGGAKDNNIGGAAPAKKSTIWDEKVEELVIPDLENDAEEEMTQQISAPAPI